MFDNIDFEARQIIVTWTKADSAKKKSTSFRTHIE